MYDSPHYRLQQVPHLQLLELLLLDDGYDAQGIAAAAAAELGSKSAEQLKWQVVVRLFELQHNTAHALMMLPGYAAAMEACAAKLRAVLGDLEVAWQLEESAQVLQQLPFSLLLRPLSDPDTQVASEDTVVFTIGQWLTVQQQQQQCEGLTEDQLAQLVRHICMPRCVISACPGASYLHAQVRHSESCAPDMLIKMASRGNDAVLFKSHSKTHRVGPDLFDLLDAAG
jgi:hypothetical protein